jgi:hypothetical protein
MKTLKIVLLTLLGVWCYNHPHDTSAFFHRLGHVLYSGVKGMEEGINSKDSGTKVMTRDEDPFPLLPDLPPVHEQMDE